MASYPSLRVTAPRPCASLGKAVGGLSSRPLVFIINRLFWAHLRGTERSQRQSGRPHTRASCPPSASHSLSWVPLPQSAASLGAFLSTKAHTVFTFTSLSLMSLRGPRTPPGSL